MVYENINTYVFVIPFIVAVFIQLIKLVVDFVKTGKWVWANLLVSGGFPSVHSGWSASMTTLVGLLEGLESTMFAIAFSLSFLFWYDAMNVRYEAGKHAESINVLRKQLEKDQHAHHKVVLLKERIGHTPLEVIGGIVIGSVLTVLIILWGYIF